MTISLGPGAERKTKKRETRLLTSGSASCIIIKKRVPEEKVVRRYRKTLAEKEEKRMVRSRTVSPICEDILASPITALSGIGPAKATAYGRLGIFTVGDLLAHYPRAYENRGDVKLLSEAAFSDGKSAVVLTVGTEPKSTNVKRGMNLTKFRAYDDSGIAEITFFNQPFMKDKFPLGADFRFYGRVDISGRRYVMSSPVCEYWDAERPPRDLVSVYRMTEGLGANQIAKDVRNALALCGEYINDPIPTEIIEKYRLCSLKDAVRNIHFPEDYRSLANAKRRLIFDEFFKFALGISATKQRSRTRGAPVCRDTDISEFLAALPYRLTDAQERAVGEISSDMAKDESMNRILVGDVGCGKTVCAAAAMYIAVKNGRQAVLMAPTEILARQHYADLSELFGRLGIECGLLIGATPAAQKRRIKARLASNDSSERLSVVIGTQALISDGVEFAAPGVVITDEQHRFGVGQRAALAGKNGNAHFLVMSATPIPRSMALIMYGDLDMSKIDTMPPGRQRVDTFAVDESYRPRLEAFIEKQVGMGGQVYIVCPAIEESENDAGEIGLDEIGTDPAAAKKNEAAIPSRLRAVEEFSGELVERFPQLNIGVIHGKMQSGEKDAVMRDFADGKLNILVSTTVIEVGVNVPNACLMIVENAERFGLSQLHQLRGRVGRGQRKSYCVLISAAASGELKGTTAGKRLQSLCTLYDGYAIAEQDLLMRGPGDFFGKSDESSIRQSGGIRLKLAEQCDDSSLMSSAFAEANALVGLDPGLSHYPLLRAEIERMISLESGIMN